MIRMTRTHRLLIRLRPVLRFIKTRVLHIDDTPERIARGIAIGVFTAWLPLFGLQIFLSLIIAAILRANKVMALLFIWISNPLTALFIYYPAYRIGRFILGFFQKEPTVPPEQMESMFERTLSMERIFWEIFTPDLWKQLWATFSQVGLEMFIGGVLLGLIAADISYRLSLTGITRFRARRRRRRAGSAH
jgi:hypothetical protein